MRAAIVKTILWREWYETVRNRLLMSTILVPPIALTIAPVVLAAAMNAPSATPGFWCGSPTRHCAAMSCPEISSRSMSMPISAAGTSPKSDNAEKRPPISDGLMNTSRNRCSIALR